jgi:hypothetical protein
MSVHEGPYVTALLCEKVIEEKDGVKSAIRIVDRITRTMVGPDASAELQPFDYPIFLLIRMKPGRARGVYGIKVNLVKPSGDSVSVLQGPINFEGDEDRGVDIVGQIQMRIETTGIYWFEVSLDDKGKEELMTRLPFRVIYLPQITPKLGGSGNPLGQIGP